MISFDNVTRMVSDSVCGILSGREHCLLYHISNPHIVPGTKFGSMSDTMCDGVSVQTMFHARLPGSDFTLSDMLSHRMSDMVSLA